MKDFFARFSSSSDSELPTLTEEEQLLRQQTIDENQHGTIVKDFQTKLILYNQKELK